MQHNPRSLFMAPFWGRGFRPFFFSGALFGALGIFIWAAFYAGFGVSPPAFLQDPVLWHAHEMIYGFSMAIVAGFLLTAVANWTGGAPARQRHLAALFLLWMAGRVVMAVDLGLPVWLFVVIEASFIPAVAVSLAIPLLRSWNKRNFVFLTILSVVFGCDVWFLSSGNISALYGALMMILMMVSLIGGRVIPAFTVAALRWRGIMAYQTDQPRMDMLAMLSLAGIAACLLFFGETPALGVVAGLSCLIHAWRMRHYHTLKTGADPLVWILHVGFGWLVLGLGLLSLAGFGLLPLQAVVHALTAGCIGSMILGMICRVTLGHTGRPLQVGRLTVLSFWLLQAAVVLRVFGPMVVPQWTQMLIVVSGILWGACFVAYLKVYAAMLFAPRPDGQAA